jgi:acetylglutamate kinase
VDGQRVSDAETVQIAQMVLTGRTNPDLVAAIHQQGGRVIGLSGKDGGAVRARRRGGKKDLGFVGEVEHVEPGMVHGLITQGLIPVMAPIAAGPEGETLNINADHFAGRIAGPLGASKLILLTDVRGVLADQSDPDSLISKLTAGRAREMKEARQIDAGMIPKVDACLDALAAGVDRCHIIDGRLPHALLMELFTDVGIGTMVVEE